MKMRMQTRRRTEWMPPYRRFTEPWREVSLRLPRRGSGFCERVEGWPQLLLQHRLGPVGQGARRAGPDLEDLAHLLVGKVVHVVEHEDLALRLRQVAERDREQPVRLAAH